MTVATNPTPETRAEVEEAMANVVATIRRCPVHWIDRRASLHGRLNQLLDQHEALLLEELLAHE